MRTIPRQEVNAILLGFNAPNTGFHCNIVSNYIFSLQIYSQHIQNIGFYKIYRKIHNINSQGERDAADVMRPQREEKERKNRKKKQQQQNYHENQPIRLKCLLCVRCRLVWTLLLMCVLVDKNVRRLNGFPLGILTRDFQIFHAQRYAAWVHQSLTIANEEAEVRRLVIVYPSGIFMIANVKLDGVFVLPFYFNFGVQITCISLIHKIDTLIYMAFTHFNSNLECLLSMHKHNH